MCDGYLASKKGMKYIMNGIKENRSEMQKRERPKYYFVVCDDLDEGRIKTTIMEIEKVHGI